MAIEHTLLGLAFTLLVALVTSIWKFSALATKLQDTVSALEKKDKELEEKTKVLEQIPNVLFRLEQIEKNFTMYSNLMSRVVVLEEAAKFSKQIRETLLRKSTTGEKE